MTKILVTGHGPVDTSVLSDSYKLDKVPDDGFALETHLAPHIHNAHGYVILPDADPLMATSILVYKQYPPEENPEEVTSKPVVIYSPDDHPSPFIELVRDFREKGFVRQPEEQFYYIAKTMEEIGDILSSKIVNPLPIEEWRPHEPEKTEVKDYSNGKQPANVSVAIFCSASTKEQKYIDLAKEVGEMVARNGWGVVFGAGNVSMMGASSHAAKETGAFVTGHTTPHFYATEFKEQVHGHPEKFVDSLSIHPDIYVRMSHMFKESQTLLVLPGGLGTVQEMLAALKVKATDAAHANKPIAILNHEGFYDKTITILEQYGYEAGKDFIVASTVEAMEAKLQNHFQRQSIDITGKGDSLNL